MRLLTQPPSHVNLKFNIIFFLFAARIALAGCGYVSILYVIECRLLFQSVTSSGQHPAQYFELYYLENTLFAFYFSCSFVFFLFLFSVSCALFFFLLHDLWFRELDFFVVRCVSFILCRFNLNDMISISTKHESELFTLSQQFILLIWCWKIEKKSRQRKKNCFGIVISANPCDISINRLIVNTIRHKDM